MAMQSSRDIGDTIGLLFTELEKLGIVTLRCGILIIEKETWKKTTIPKPMHTALAAFFNK